MAEEDSVLLQIVGICGALLGATLGWALTYFSGLRAERLKKQQSISEAIDACSVEMLYLMQHNSNNLRRLKEYSDGADPRLLDLKKMKYTARGFLKLGPAEISALPGHIAPEMLHFLAFIENNEAEYDACIEEFESLLKDKETFKARSMKLEQRTRSAVLRSLHLVKEIEKIRLTFGKDPMVDLDQWLENSPHPELRDSLENGNKKLPR